MSPATARGRVAEDRSVAQRGWSNTTVTEATTEEYAAEIISLAEALTIFRRSDTATLGLPGGPGDAPGIGVGGGDTIGGPRHPRGERNTAVTQDGEEVKQTQLPNHNKGRDSASAASRSHPVRARWPVTEPALDTGELAYSTVVNSLLDSVR